MAHNAIPRPYGERPDLRQRPGTAGRYLDRTRGRRLAAARRPNTLGFGFFFILIFSVIAGLSFVAALGLGSVLVSTTAELPPVTELSSQFTFKTTQILDRNGTLLYEVNDENGGRRLPVPLSEVSPFLIDATIATEDKDFYVNPGVDPVGIVRAAMQNITTGELSQGASTITQQLAKNELIELERRQDKHWTRKLQEAILAVRISERYSKDEILEMYLNGSFYGHLSYGVEAAAETYFGKHARDLNLAESALIAGLPQAPSDYDPYLNMGNARARQAHVLNRMVAQGYITQETADEAQAAPLSLKADNTGTFRAPHFVMYVRQLLVDKYGPELVYKGGLTVTTTLDLAKYDLAVNAVRTHLESLKKQDANNAGLVSIDVKTGQIIAMVGSKDYFDSSIDGQVNMATAPRPPGSTIKPIEYAAAFMKGWGPETVITDFQTDFPNTFEYLPPYRPHNFDGRFDGAMTIRHALSNSKNIPAVKALMYVGIPDFLRIAESLGLNFQNPEVFGLAIGLGGSPVPLLHMAGAYTAFAANGVYRKPTAILKVEDWQGNVLEEFQPTEGKQVLDPAQAYMITSILADNWARTPLQGPNSILNLSRPAAAKTGSTDSYKDSWMIGYTPDLVTGVWVGNTNNKPMKEVLGSMGAGRIWNRFMEDAHVSLPVRDFTPPPGVREYRLCKQTGQPATPECEEVIQEVWPIAYTPAPLAVIPGLDDVPDKPSTVWNGMGKPLGQTVSAAGISLQPWKKGVRDRDRE